MNTAEPGDEKATEKGVGDRIPREPLRFPLVFIDWASSDENVGSRECDDWSPALLAWLCASSLCSASLSVTTSGRSSVYSTEWSDVALGNSELIFI